MSRRNRSEAWANQQLAQRPVPVAPRPPRPKRKHPLVVHMRALHIAVAELSAELARVMRLQQLDDWLAARIRAARALAKRLGFGVHRGDV